MWIVDEGRAVWDRSSPGDVLVGGQDGVEVEAQLWQGEQDHDQGGRGAGELLHIGEHPGHTLQGALLLTTQSVVSQHLW